MRGKRNMRGRTSWILDEAAFQWCSRFVQGRVEASRSRHAEPEMEEAAQPQQAEPQPQQAEPQLEDALATEQKEILEQDDAEAQGPKEALATEAPWPNATDHGTRPRHRGNMFTLDPPLPPGWHIAYDQRYDRAYYWHDA